MSKRLLISILFLFAIFAFASIVKAQEIPNSQFLFKLPGVVEATGIHFEITDSSYLNVIADSSEPIKLRMESIPEMITMMIEPPAFSITTSTQITLSGFTPSTTYYKYQDDYHNLTEFTTDENGKYTYFQNLSSPHVVFIQPRKSTKFIKDDATGGDCSLIGIWDSNAKTCILTIDLNETIQIDNDGITLDGNGHTITGSNSGYGIYLNSRMGITVKNFNIKNFSYGLFFYNVENSIIEGISISDNWYGGYFQSANSNSFISNTINNNSNGIFLNSSNNNNFSSNIISGNYFGIGITFSSNNNNLIRNIIDSNNYVGINLLESNFNVVDNNIISNNRGSQGGILVVFSNNNTFIRNTILNNRYGISLSSYTTNKIYNNNFISNQFQVDTLLNSNNIFNLSFPTGGNYWSNFDQPSEGCIDSNNDNFCDSPYVFSGGQDNFPWIKQDGWQAPPPVLEWVEMKTDGECLYKDESGNPSSTKLKCFPNGWILKRVIENGVPVENGDWWKVIDVTDEISGWARKDDLNYQPEKQSEWKSKTEKLDPSKNPDQGDTTPVILEAVNHYYNNTDAQFSLYSSKDKGNDFSIFKNINFPTELILAISAQESHIINFDNEWVVSDYGHGVMQVTFSPKYKWDNRGIGSNLKISPCSLGGGQYKNCYGDIHLFPVLGASTDYGRSINAASVWPRRDYQELQINDKFYTFKYYINSIQSIYANVKDGLRVLQEKYTAKCPKESIRIREYEFSCRDIEKFLMVWGYNGFAKDKKTGEYLGTYLKDVADKLSTLNTYFPGITYPNIDNLIEKLKIANDNKKTIRLYSPGEIYIIDSEGRITGLFKGEIKEGIPNSVYDPNNKAVVILFPNNAYSYNVVGTKEGTYGLSIDSTDNGAFTLFNATDIPISASTIHQYTIDWQKLSRGETGVTLQIDTNGDGIFEKTVIADNNLTYDEFILQTETTIDLDPDVLNLKSKGKFITAYIELPVGFDVNQIDISSIFLNNSVISLSRPTEIGDYDNDGLPDLMVKFERSRIQNILGPGEKVPITITGKVFHNGNYLNFKGDDKIRVIK